VQSPAEWMDEVHLQVVVQGSGMPTLEVAPLEVAPLEVAPLELPLACQALPLADLAGKLPAQVTVEFQMCAGYECTEFRSGSSCK